MSHDSKNNPDRASAHLGGSKSKSPSPPRGPRDQERDKERVRRDAIDKEGAARRGRPPGPPGWLRSACPKRDPNQCEPSVQQPEYGRTGAADEGVAFFWSAAIIFSLHSIHLDHLAPRRSNEGYVFRRRRCHADLTLITERVVVCGITWWRIGNQKYSIRIVGVRSWRKEGSQCPKLA